MSILRNISQPGLVWEKRLLSDAPTWSIEPSIDVIEKLARRYLDCDCNVAFFSQGAFNKLYSVDSSREAFVFRVTLPVAPKTKTLSEVATMSFVRETTSIPVPRILAYNTDLDNELGFEWILMERINGRPLQECWHELSWLKKGLLVQQVAEFVSELSHLEMFGIGSIYDHHPDNELKETTPAVERVVGEAVVPLFFVRDHIQLDVHRGPYQSSAEYVTAHTQFLLHDINR
jgi:aminoglycoside phosphotransferase